jgi:hypothetical protein
MTGDVETVKVHYGVQRKIVPLISVLLVGLLTVDGGFLANYFLQLSSRSSQRNQLVRDKLEEAHLLALEVKDWLQSEMRTIAAHSASDESRIQTPIRKLVMLTRCYYPASSAVASKLSAQKVPPFTT